MLNISFSHNRNPINSDYVINDLVLPMVLSARDLGLLYVTIYLLTIMSKQ